MNRPLIQRRIDELEAMFEAEQGDPDALRLLEAELAFRSVPRAVTLFNRLKRVLDGGTILPSPRQNILFDHKAPVASQSSAFGRNAVYAWSSHICDDA
jgi:hypothetical protein